MNLEEINISKKEFRKLYNAWEATGEIVDPWAKPIPR
jgi:hypothetical protein